MTDKQIFQAGDVFGGLMAAGFIVYLVQREQYTAALVVLGIGVWAYMAQESRRRALEHPDGVGP